MQRVTVSRPARRLLALAFVLNSVLVATGFHVAAQSDETLPLFALPDANRYLASSSNSLALGADGLTLAAVNMLNNSVTIVAPAQSRIVAEIPVGRDPRSAAYTPDGQTLLVTNRQDHTLSIIDARALTVRATVPLAGLAPYGVVSNNNSLAYVALTDTDEVVIVDLATNTVSAHIPVNDGPAGLAVWGDFLYVTHLWSGELTLIYLPEQRVRAVVSTGVDTGMFQSLEIDVTRGLAYLPQTRSNAQNRALTYDSTVFPVVNVVNLATMQVEAEARIALDIADRPVNMPFSAAVDRFREWLFVANAGTNDVSVIDLNTGIARARLSVGANPRGILLNQATTRLYVHNTLDGTLTTIETATLAVRDTLPITSINIPTDLLIGMQFFHNASDLRLSADGWMSCANCHFEGRSDRRVWQGFPDGPRNTPVLYDMAVTAPYNWSGTWDELADVELKIRWLQGGSGLIDPADGQPSPALAEPHSGRSPDLDTLVSYLIAMPTPEQNPPVETGLVEQGAQVFETLQCATCHIGAVGSNLQLHDVGTGTASDERAGTQFDTPSMRWLWQSAPYLHDGSAATLTEVFTLPGAHQLLFDVPPDEIAALVAYLGAQPAAPMPPAP